MDGIIKVDPQKLIEASQEFSGEGSKVANLTSEMLNIMNGLPWESDAAQAYKAKARALDSDISKLNTMIQEHVTDLQEMATVFMNADTAAQGEADALVSSVIS